MLASILSATSSVKVVEEALRFKRTAVMIVVAKPEPYQSGSCLNHLYLRRHRLTQRRSYDLAMAGVLICSALEAYEGDGKAIHCL